MTVARQHEIAVAQEPVSAPATNRGLVTSLRPKRLRARCRWDRMRRSMYHFGLYAEQLSGTAFTAPRALNRRTWVYRIRPSVMHKPYSQIANGLLRSTPFDEVPDAAQSTALESRADSAHANGFSAGLRTLGGQWRSGDRTVAWRFMSMRPTAAWRSLYCYDADGELLLVPQMGRLLIHTELGRMALAPGEIAVIPRGIKFRVELLDGEARGYVCENYGATFRLPELGPIGANCLANSRDFQTPVAAFEDIERHGAGGLQIPGKSVGERVRSLAAGRGRLAWQLCALQVRSGALLRASTA